MLRIPDKSEFPGTGASIQPVMKTQHYCHALGSKGIRIIPKELGNFHNSIEAWTKRIEAGQAQTNMAVTLSRLGSKKALALFADWTDCITAGELPFTKPQRPQGIERNAVISMWEWSTRKAYLHDAISTDKRNPWVNANGPISGSPEESTNMVPVLNPVTNETWQVIVDCPIPNRHLQMALA